MKLHILSSRRGQTNKAIKNLLNTLTFMIGKF